MAKRKRLGKRERAALAAKAQRRKAIVARNLRVQPEDDRQSMRETLAYRPPIERLSQYACGRVMHNYKGITPASALPKGNPKYRPNPKRKRFHGGNA